MVPYQFMVQYTIIKPLKFVKHFRYGTGILPEDVAGIIAMESESSDQSDDENANADMDHDETVSETSVPNFLQEELIIGDCVIVEFKATEKLPSRRYAAKVIEVDMEEEECNVKYLKLVSGSNKLFVPDCKPPSWEPFCKLVRKLKLDDGVHLRGDQIAFSDNNVDITI
jgi:hypothetical protein